MSPAFNKPLPIFHNAAVPQVVIVANGGDCGSCNPTTHFSATSTYTLHTVIIIHIFRISIVYNVSLFCQKHIVGVLGANSKIGRGIPFTMPRYFGAKAGNSLCDLYYEDNEKQYALHLLYQVNTGLIQCKQRTDQLRQELQAVANRRDRLQARLARLGDNSTASIHAGM